MAGKMPHPQAPLAWVRSDAPARAAPAAASSSGAAASSSGSVDHSSAAPAAAAAAELDADSEARVSQQAALAEWDESAAGQRRAEARAAAAAHGVYTVYPSRLRLIPTGVEVADGR